MLNASFNSLKSPSKPSLSFPIPPFPSNFKTIATSRNETVNFFDLLLHQSTGSSHPKQIHSQIIVTGNPMSGFLSARLVSVYSQFGLLCFARKVFDKTPERERSNILLWNSILRGYLSNGCSGEVLKLYVEMRESGVLGDEFSFPLVIKGCGLVGNERLCKVVHCNALQMGLGNNVHVANELMGMYGRLGRMDVAKRVFDFMSGRNIISWNLMVSGFAGNFDCDGASEMFRRMESEGVKPNLVTWTSLLSSHARCGHLEEIIELFGEMRIRGIGVNAEALTVVLSACSNTNLFGKGKAIHGLVVKDGFANYMIVKHALISLYAEEGKVKCARQLFAEIENKNVVSWNALITAYTKSRLCDEALEAFSELENGNNCSSLRPNVISWSAIIDGFASVGRGEESLELFRQMQLANNVANVVTICTVLSVCAELAALNLGREIHGHVVRASMDSNILVGNSLITMYMRCGCLKEGHLVFERIQHKDLISWNSLIAGYGMHGFGKDALRYFNRMVEAGFKPDEVTFIAILSACSHAGLISDGRDLYNQMSRRYGIKPRMEHYACMVDLLGRSSLLHEASEVVKSMPMAPNACVWGALLNACRMHRNTDIAEATAAYIFSSRSEATGSYMLLSNIYAENGRWDESALVRMSAKEKGLKKVTGQSWIELKKKVYSFSSGSTVMPGLEEVYGVLKVLRIQMDPGKKLEPAH